MDYASYAPEDLERVKRTLWMTGYKLLQPDVDTIMTGDEGYDHMCNTWEPVMPGSGGVVRSNWALYRRKLAPTSSHYCNLSIEEQDKIAAELAVDGYELLRPGDVVQEGDEYCVDNSAQWYAFSSFGSIITHEFFIVRRGGLSPVKPEPAHSEGDRLMQFFFGCGG